eukprot:gene15104-biopygen4088
MVVSLVPPGHADSWGCEDHWPGRRSPETPHHSGQLAGLGAYAVAWLLQGNNTIRSLRLELVLRMERAATACAALVSWPPWDTRPEEEFAEVNREFGISESSANRQRIVCDSSANRQRIVRESSGNRSRIIQESSAVCIGRRSDTPKGDKPKRRTDSETVRCSVGMWGMRFRHLPFQSPSPTRV